MVDQFPLEGYIRTESAVEGIDVFMPAPEDDKQEAVVDFKCPRCAARTAYSVTDGGLKCSNCGYYEAPEQKVVGKGAEQFEFKVETVQQSAQGWGEVRQQLE